MLFLLLLILADHSIVPFVFFSLLYVFSLYEYRILLAFIAVFRLILTCKRVYTFMEGNLSYSGTTRRSDTFICIGLWAGANTESSFSTLQFV